MTVDRDRIGTRFYVPGAGMVCLHPVSRLGARKNARRAVSDETCPVCKVPKSGSACLMRCGYPRPTEAEQLKAQLAETSLRLEQAELRIQEEDARAEGWKDTADERLRRLTQAERCIAAADRMRDMGTCIHTADGRMYLTSEAKAYDTERAKF